jgi:hypothetical protein
LPDGTPGGLVELGQVAVAGQQGAGIAQFGQPDGEGGVQQRQLQLDLLEGQRRGGTAMAAARARATGILGGAAFVTSAAHWIGGASWQSWSGLNLAAGPIPCRA